MWTQKTKIAGWIFFGQIWFWTQCCLFGWISIESIWRRLLWCILWRTETSYLVAFLAAYVRWIHLRRGQWHLPASRVLEILVCRVKKSYLVTFLATLWIGSIWGGDVHMHQLSVHPAHCMNSNPAHCMHSSSRLTSLVMVELHGGANKLNARELWWTFLHNIFSGRLI